MNNLTIAKEGEEIEKLRAQNKFLYEKLDTANSQVGSYSAEVDALRAELSTAHEQINNQCSHMAEHESECSELYRQIDYHHTNASTLRTELDSLKSGLTNNGTICEAELRAELDELKNNGEFKLTGYGQVKIGDRVEFSIGRDTYSEKVKKIINLGTDKEEVIYNVKKNFYFITSMVIAGSSNHRNLRITRPVPAIPEGYALVPVEPTDEMLEDCGTIANYADDEGDPDADHIAWYKAMIAAAQKGGV